MRLALLALAALLAASPAAAATWGSVVRGNGQKTTVARELPPFTKVRLETSLDVRVKVAAPQRVAVTIDSNLQPEIVTRVDDDTLVIEARHEVRYEGRGHVELGLAALRGFRIDGSGDVRIEGSEGGDLTLEDEGSGDLRWSGRAGALRASVSGSGDIRLTGKADRLEAEVEGSGEVKARDLAATSAKVEVAGSGDVELTLAGGTLSVEVEGSGNVLWWGEAKLESATVSGSGEIAHR